MRQWVLRQVRFMELSNLRLAPHEAWWRLASRRPARGEGEFSNLQSSFKDDML